MTVDRTGTTPAPIEDLLAAAGLPPLPRSAWLEIDLDRLAANLAEIRAVVPPGVRVEPVLKADAYGHGAVPVGRALAAAGADGFSVATLDEAIELRHAGLRLPILCLYAIPAGLVAEAMRRRIDVTASDEVLLGRMLTAASRAWAGELPGGRPRRALWIHLDVETGLGRTGIAADRVTAAADAIAATPGARLAGVWSHLQAGLDHGRSVQQDLRLAQAIGLVTDGFKAVPARHLAASAGLLSGTVPVYDAVRVGLITYGVVPDDLGAAVRARPPASTIRPVLSLHARPVRVADLPSGHGISYGPTFTTARPSRIATLPVGYGDGYARSLSNRAEVLVRGRRAPVVGSVAMDAVMIDVTDVARPGEAPVGVDDEFVLIGSQGSDMIELAELARLRTTITWEAVVSMSRRLPRVYHAAAVPLGLRTLTTEQGR